MLIGFFLSEEVLYERNLYDGTLLRYVDAIKSQTIMVEIHKGIRATHANRHMMNQQIMRIEYYLMTLERDFKTS